MRLFLAGILCIFVLSANAAQPEQFNYQAILRDADGALLEGPHTLHIGLWEGGTAGAANSGFLRYAETANVSVSDGVVNHVIGTGTPVGSPLDAAALDTDAAMFVQVAVDSPANVILPRTQLQPVPYAIQAATALNGVPTGTVILGTTTTTPAGYTWLGNELSSAWNTRAPMTTARQLHGACAAQGRLFVVAGLANSSPIGSTEFYTPATNAWTTTAPLPTPRYNLSVTELGGFIYAVGGDVGGFTFTALHDRYDPAVGAWTSRQVLPAIRGRHSAATANGKLYVMGGHNGTNYLDSALEYNPAGNEWTGKASMPTARSNTAAATVDNKIFLIGGYGPVTAITTHEMFDPVANTWTPKAPLPYGLYAHAASSFGGKVYVTGGTKADNQVNTETFVYDPQADSWTVGTPMPSRRSDHGSAVLDGRIYVTGGIEALAGAPNASVLSWSPGIYYPWVKD